METAKGSLKRIAEEAYMESGRWVLVMRKW